MTNHAPDVTPHRPEPTSPAADRTPAVERPARTLELADWIEARIDRLSERWYQDIQARQGLPEDGVDGLLEEFLHLLTAFLPGLLGPRREFVDPLWTQAANLFGALAARRGLAAGEVIEEFQILREAVIRLLYQDPPGRGRARLSLRDVLRLNRAIDRGVTHASVGHTDALFYSLFEGSGIPDSPPTERLVAEARAQLDDVRGELRELLGRVPGELLR